MISHVRVKLKAQQKLVANRNYDVDRLKSEDVKAQYQTIIMNRFEAPADREDMDGEERWSNIKEVVNGTAKEAISYKKKHQEPWVNENSRVLSETQIKRFISSQGHRKIINNSSGFHKTQKYNVNKRHYSPNTSLRLEGCLS